MDARTPLLLRNALRNALRSALPSALRLALVSAAAVGLAGCVAKTVRVVDLSPPQQVQAGIAEDMLLDVGVSVFDANVPESFDERVERNINPEVRRAEANYMAFFTKNLLQSTGNWGAVRVAPRETFAVDVVVSGSIAHSDGERMELDVVVTDARGVVWFERNYLTLASKYAYEDGIPPGIDPFQATYRRLADDMLAFYQTLSADDIRRIRTTAEMRFARDFSPDAFGSYVEASKSGSWDLRRLPAEDDPMLGRVRQVREREYLFIDTLDEYFDSFHAQMSESYQEWRAATYDEAIAYRRVTDKAKRKTLIGAAALAGGIIAQASDSDVARYGGATGIIAGATLSVSAVGDRAEAKLHSEVLQELGMSAEAEISPHTIELENQTLRLQGTVDDQYEQLRRILKRIYLEELELALPATEGDEATTGFDADEAFRRAAAPESECERGGCPAQGQRGADGDERTRDAGPPPGRFLNSLDGEPTDP